MRQIIACLTAGLVGVSGCQRSGKLPMVVVSSDRRSDQATNTVGGSTAATQTTAMGLGARSTAAVPRFASRVGNGQNRPIRRGALKVKVYDTPLEIQLDALTIFGGGYKLEGFGVRYVGSMSQNWQAQFGKPVAIERRNAAFGDSEMDLPMVGKVGVVGGTILLDEVVEQDFPRCAATSRLRFPDPMARPASRENLRLTSSSNEPVSPQSNPLDGLPFGRESPSGPIIVR